MEDTQIVCATCGESFPWSAEQSMFYQRHGLPTPTLCIPCRVTRRGCIVPIGRPEDDGEDAR
jgi:hypothetical protein